jgi:two pore calcium channel protein 3
VLILVNAFCIGFNINEAEWFFLAAFTAEIVLMLYAHGPVKYFTKFWNM